MENEIDYRNIAETLFIKRMITEVYPTGIVSLVSDTFDLFSVITKSLPLLKEDIMARNGGEGSIDKVVIRPDSGNPADILCGTLGKIPRHTHKEMTFEQAKALYESKVSTLDSLYFYYENDCYLVEEHFFSGSYDTYVKTKKTNLTPEQKGVVELLFEIFGGTTNELGYKVLDSHIGTIYGDAITIDRCREICERLKAKGFATTNVVYGIGSYTYQYLTRDSLGFAMKATSVTINGEEQAIFKDPKTDSGTKKSALGRVEVSKDENGKLRLTDDSTGHMVQELNLLTPLFVDGKLVKETTLADIRKKLG